MAAHLAVCNVFPNVMTEGCLSHFGQSLIRNMQHQAPKIPQVTKMTTNLSTILYDNPCDEPDFNVEVSFSTSRIFSTTSLVKTEDDQDGRPAVGPPQPRPEPEAFT
uniref:Uncharacterized protein n=1 Tax=Romanomermis culicivorax TaxID=13658 RepID=A0A915JIJ6_ROMCU